MGVQLYRVYVIKNDMGRRYIGLSDDIPRRLGDHNAGVSKWTAKYRPWCLVWTSIPLALSAARKLENLLKRQKGGIGLQPLLNQHGTFSGS
jgi:putative endonuclease